MENEEARSRQRAQSLADLIRDGQTKNEGVVVGGASGAGGEGRRGKAGGTPAVPSWRTKRWGVGQNKGSGGPASNGASPGGRNPGSSERTAAAGGAITIGFGKGAISRRAASMVDPRDAEKAALLNELEMRQARKKAVAPPHHKLSIVEKHLYRERKFQEQREKRRAAAEREALKRVRVVGCRPCVRFALGVAGEERSCVVCHQRCLSFKGLPTWGMDRRPARAADTLFPLTGAKFEA